MKYQPRRFDMKKETVYLCKFVNKKFPTSEFKNYESAKSFAESVGESCMVYSPTGKEIGAYMGRKWLMIH
jgi:hypothetical protein